MFCSHCSNEYDKLEVQIHKSHYCYVYKYVVFHCLYLYIYFIYTFNLHFSAYKRHSVKVGISAMTSTKQ
jgi:hypothetical protein